MRRRVPLKQGDELAIRVLLKSGPRGGPYVPRDLTGLELEARSVRPDTRVLGATFTVEVLDQTEDATKGRCIMRATPEESAKLRQGDELDLKDLAADFTYLELSVDLSREVVPS